MAKTVVHLIHGTWPYGLLAHYLPRLRRPAATWFYESSSFCTALKAALPPDVTVRTFHWSGDNSYLERHLAADRLARELYDFYLKDDETRHVLIAHSHGGNVAMLAARHPLMPPLAGIATLASPFLHVERRTQTPQHDRLLRHVQLAAMLLTMAILVLGLFGQFNQLNVLSFANSSWRATWAYAWDHPLFLSVVMVLLWVLGGVIVQARRLRRIAGELPVMVLPRRTSWLIVRAPGDEAGLVLAGARLAHAALGFVWRPLRALLAFMAPALKYDWFLPLLAVPLAGVSSVLPSVGRMLFLNEPWPIAWRHVVPEHLPADSPLLQRLPFDAVRPVLDVMAPFSAAALALLLVLGVLLFIAGLLLAPFGWELLFMGLAVDVTAEPTPVGDTYPVLMLQYATGRLRHSVYESQDARTQLAQWITQVAMPVSSAAVSNRTATQP